MVGGLPHKIGRLPASRWEDVEPGMYNISYDLFRWMVKWYEPIWWCGVKDEENSCGKGVNPPAAFFFQEMR